MLNHWILLFYIYGFLGWCTEVVYAALVEGRFVNRGFLNGPICPIYGFGILSVVSILFPLKDNIFFLFVGSVIISSVVELLGGFILEILFHQKWWDYSDRPFNLAGYVCPMFSILWGVGCLIVVGMLHPFIASNLFKVPSVFLWIGIAILTFVLSIDIMVTVNTVFQFNKKLERLKELSDFITWTSDEIGEHLAERTLKIISDKETMEEKLYDDLKKLQDSQASKFMKREQGRIEKLETIRKYQEEYKSLLKNHSPGHKRLLRAFPGVKSIKYKKSLEKVKKYWRDKNR